MESVVVLGANPAWQRNVACAQLRPGEVVRLKRGLDGAAGKGFNCSLALARLGARVRLISGVGTDSASWEAACRAEGILLDGFPLSGSTRSATTLRDLSSGEVTELVEEGPSAVSGATELLEQLLRRDQDLPIAVCGTLAGGIDPDQIAEALADRRGIVVIDSVSVVRSLSTGSSAPPRLYLKLNESEWMALDGTGLGEALAHAQRRFPQAHLICTRGARGSKGMAPDGARFDLPAPPFPAGTEVHPIGAGDAFTAGLFHALVEGRSFQVACIHGAAAARASCLDPLPSRLSLESFRDSLAWMDSHA